MLSNEQRRAWLVRGLQDPVKAYRSHAVSAAKRGIGFELTFAEWWALWEPHYEERGVHAGQKVMCRTGDIGAYEVGNVRIDSVRANAEERGRVHRARNLAAGRLPTAKGRAVLSTQDPDDWLRRRKWALDPYTEEEEDA